MSSLYNTSLHSKSTPILVKVVVMDKVLERENISKLLWSSIVGGIAASAALGSVYV